MSKKAKIIIAIASVLAIGGITAFFVFRKSDDEIDSGSSGADTGGSASDSQSGNTASVSDGVTETKYGEWQPFGWVGGQTINGESMSGLHIYQGNNGKFKVGDFVQVDVKIGDKIYNGIHRIAKLGTDDDVAYPEYINTMITIEIPKRGQAEGRVRKVENYQAFDGSYSSDKIYLNYKG